MKKVINLVACGGDGQYVVSNFPCDKFSWALITNSHIEILNDRNITAALFPWHAIVCLRIIDAPEAEEMMK